jgi:molybdopterin molybdotransferase
MDGYAVRAMDTFGATPGLPQYLEIRGSVPMGEAPAGVVAGGEAWRIATGGMLPAGADAVVMVEYTNEMPDGTLEVRRPVAPGENVLQPGEDVKAHEPLFPAGASAPPGHRSARRPGDQPGHGVPAPPGGGAVERR